MNIQNLQEVPYWIYLVYIKYGIEHELHIKTKSIGNRGQWIQDAQIGDYAENWYIRPRKACQMKPYKTLASYKMACTKAVQHHIKDCKVLRYYKKEKVRTGDTFTEYEVNI